MSQSQKRGKESGSMPLSRSMIILLALFSLGVMTGCSRAHSFNILGSFFPAWLICMISGVAFSSVVNWVLTIYKLDKEIAWKILVYPCLATFLACALWLLFFS